MKRKLGAQLHLKSELEKDNIVVDYDDLWIKTPESYTDTPGVYVRNEQEKEIDALWSGLKEAHIPKRSPVVYLGIGFGAGLVVAFIISTILFWGTNNNTTAANVDVRALETPIIEQTHESIKVPAETTVKKNQNQKEYKDLVSYTIQSGDTLGNIAERFYKSSAPKYVTLIQRANNLKSPHSITAGQKLLIPVKQ